jgi:hypothetical protein
VADTIPKPQASQKSNAVQRNPANLERCTARPGKSQRINTRQAKKWKLSHVPCNTHTHRLLTRESGMSLLDAFLASGVVLLIVLIILKKKTH